MDKKRVKRLATYTLLFSYLIVVILIFLFQYKLVHLSFELLFLSFVLSGLLFYFFRIDSRYLILPAIFLLWFIPFLLKYKLENAAEATAIYVYYFLVVGIILKFIEFKFNYKANIKFELVKNILFDKNIIYFSIFWAILFMLSHLFNLSNVSKAISLYVGVTLLIIYCVQFVFDFEK